MRRIDWKTAKKMEQIEEEAKREERELSEIGLDQFYFLTPHNQTLKK